MLWGIAIASFLVAFGSVRVLLYRFAGIALDEPNARSLHERPVPRTGGLAVLLGAAVSLGLGGADVLLPYALAICLAALSFVDDVRGVPSWTRLLAHVSAAGVLAWYVLSPMHWGQLAVVIVAMVWITNLYNFMDGADGLASGMAAIGFGAYSAAAVGSGHIALAALSLALAAASLAFLLHNFHPARIFLGDVGSIPLGFLVGGLGILGWRDDVWPLWFPLLVFGPFIADATVTLLKRLLRGERVWQAHKEHYYQRMVRMGLGHRGAALAGYGVMIACAAAALAGRNQAPSIQAGAFLAGSVLLGAMAVWVDLRWTRFVRGASTTA